MATSGIIVTCEPVRDRMAAFTRSMSAGDQRHQALDRGLRPAFKGNDNGHDELPQDKTAQHRNAMVMRQVRTGCRKCFETDDGERGDARRISDGQGHEPQRRRRRTRLRVAVLVPCYNEETAIGKP